MKIMYDKIRLSALLVFIICFESLGQVGVNTTSPDNSSILDINSSEKGLLIPRVNIANLNTIAPITGGSTESLLVYNTNTATGPGFFFWDGTQWVGLSTSIDWRLSGNTGTTPGTGAGQDYIGTSDNQDFIIATNANPVLEITTDGRLENYTNGTRTSPVITWNADTNTGIFRSAQDRINISAGSREMVEFREAGTNSETVFNDGGNQTNFRIESDDEQHLFHINGTNNRIGFMQDSPLTEFHVGGANTDVRIDALNSTNNALNDGVDNSVVFVDNNGDLRLQNRVNQLILDDSDSGTFLNSPIQVTTTDGNIQGAVGYTTSITLTRETLVEFSYSLPVQLRPDGGGFIRDGNTRLFGSLLSTTAGENIVFDSRTYTNESSAVVTFGNFTTGGSGFILLPPGNHTFELFLFVTGGYAAGGTTEGTEATFGIANLSRFQIVYHN